jgi:hypothetical protein
MYSQILLTRRFFGGGPSLGLNFAGMENLRAKKVDRFWSAPMSEILMIFLKIHGRVRSSEFGQQRFVMGSDPD